MPMKEDAAIEVTALEWVPDMARGMVKDMRIRWALEEAGFDYQVRLLPGERPPEYRCEQPFNQVPYFTDGKVHIFETGAILQYLGEQSEALLPRDTEDRFRAIQWTFAAVSSVEPFVQFRALVTSFFADQPWAEPARPTFDLFARMRLQQVEDWLGDKRWLEGDRFTIGDIMMVTVLRIAARSGQLTDFPAVAAYVERGQARPAFKQALADHLAGFKPAEAMASAL